MQSLSAVFGIRVRIISLSLFIIGGAVCKGQYLVKKNGFASTVTGSAYYTPPSDFTDTTGNFTYNQLGAGFILPIIGRLKIREKGTAPKMWEIFLNAGFTVGVPEINLQYTFRPRTLYNGSAGFTGLYYFGNHNSLLGGAYAFAGEDQLTYKDPDVRYGGFLLYNHYYSEKHISIKFGGLYTYILGRGIPFPILGFSKDLSEQLCFSILFPQSMSFILSDKKQNRYSVFIKPWGGFNNFNNELKDIQFNEGKIPVIQVRRSEIRSGTDARITLHQNLLLKVEAGVLFYRKFGFYYLASNSDNDLFTTSIRPGAYFQLGLSWKIRRKNNKLQESTKDLHFSYIDLSNFDLDGLDLNDLNFDQIDFGSIHLDDIDMDDIDIEDIIN